MFAQKQSPTPYAGRGSRLQICALDDRPPPIILRGLSEGGAGGLRDAGWPRFLIAQYATITSARARQ